MTRPSTYQKNKHSSKHHHHTTTPSPFNVDISQLSASNTSIDQLRDGNGGADVNAPAGSSNVWTAIQDHSKALGAGGNARDTPLHNAENEPVLQKNKDYAATDAGLSQKKVLEREMGSSGKKMVPQQQNQKDARGTNNNTIFTSSTAANSSSFAQKSNNNNQQQPLHIDTATSSSASQYQKNISSQNSAPTSNVSSAFERQSDWSAVDAEEDMDFDDLESFLKDTIVDVNAVKEKIASEPPTPVVNQVQEQKVQQYAEQQQRVPPAMAGGRGGGARENSLSPPAQQQHHQHKILSRNAPPSSHRKPTTPSANAWASRDLPHKEAHHHERTPSPQSGGRPRSSERGRVLQSSPPRRGSYGQRGGAPQRYQGGGPHHRMPRGGPAPDMVSGGESSSRREPPLRRDSSFTPKDGAYRPPPRDTYAPKVGGSYRPPSAGRRPYDQSGRVLDQEQRRGGPHSHRRTPYTPLSAGSGTGSQQQQQQPAELEREKVPKEETSTDAPVRATSVANKPETPSSAKLPGTPNLTVQQLKEQQKVMDEMAEQRRLQRIKEEQEAELERKRMAAEKLAKIESEIAEEERKKHEAQEKKLRDEEEKVKREQEAQKKKQDDEERRRESERRQQQERLKKEEAAKSAKAAEQVASAKKMEDTNSDRDAATPTSATSSQNNKRRESRPWKERKSAGEKPSGDNRKPFRPRREGGESRYKNNEGRTNKRFDSRSKQQHFEKTGDDNTKPSNKHFSKGSEDDTRRRGPQASQGDHGKRRNPQHNRPDRQSTTPTSIIADTEHQQDDVLQRVEDTPPSRNERGGTKYEEQVDSDGFQVAQKKPSYRKGRETSRRRGKGSGGRGRGSSSRGRNQSFSSKAPQSGGGSNAASSARENTAEK
eukprot:CAMPEP_0117452012 /NCGR_PEP_ID=MMETSP0759-20121206/9345_1 /TAXON_ID=63605 /ORGANISM="Percolomonas cosmopolitus, Strain WS" /LENGTH=879 /DNA_ID=CAMNT_0005244713 /DNA_START=95 /DNA_END=2734 /DNA_ORIENTATION=-